MNVVVKKANIRAGLFLSYSFDLTDNDIKSSHNTSSDAPAHDDLKKAFRNLIPFFAHICEEITTEKSIKACIQDPDEHLERKEDDPDGKVYPFLQYGVHGFEVGGKQDYQYVQIHGTKRLSTSNEITFVTPRINLDGDYKFIIELNDAVSHLKDEVYAYMNGKQAPKEMGLFDGPEDTDEENFS